MIKWKNDKQTRRGCIQECFSCEARTEFKYYVDTKNDTKDKKKERKDKKKERKNKEKEEEDEW